MVFIFRHILLKLPGVRRSLFTLALILSLTPILVGTKQFDDFEPNLRTEYIGIDSAINSVASQSNLTQAPAHTVSDWSGDHDGYPEPNEFVTIRLPLTNLTASNASNVVVRLVGGGTVNYGEIRSGFSRSGEIPFRIPAVSPCGAPLSLTFNVTSSLGKISFVRNIILGKPRTVYSLENFDGVTAPALPAGWHTELHGAGFGFNTTDYGPDSGVNSIALNAPVNAGGGVDLVSPMISITSRTSSFSFRNSIDLAPSVAGGALEISVGGSEFQDIERAGGTFSQNGYNGTLRSSTDNPLAGRSVWTGASDYETSVVTLPASAAGKIVRLRFRYGQEAVSSSAEWSIDTVTITGGGFVSNFACSLLSELRSKGDFDGDGKTDLGVYRPDDSTWHINRSTAGPLIMQFGTPNSRPVPGDFDGDGVADISVWNENEAMWRWRSSLTEAVTPKSKGRPGDIPQVGDFDGDGLDDLAMYTPTTGRWSWQNSSNQALHDVFHGQQGDIPTVGDYDGDGRADVAIFRPSLGLWEIISSSTGQFTSYFFGLPGDLPVNADFDGDGREDIAVYRPTDGMWFYLSSISGAMVSWAWGSPGDIPISGDFDGNGTDDVGVYRGGGWLVHHMNESFSEFSWGLPTDIPVTRRPTP